MGAGARKENNARSRETFDRGRDIYNQGQTLAATPFSPGEEQGLRARALRPIEAAYGANERKMKNAALTSGGAPNLIAALAKNTRERSGALSDAGMDINTAISGEKFNRGMAARQYGMGGLGVQQGAQPIQGFNWSGLLNAGLGLGSAFLGRPNISRPVASPGRG